MMNKKINITTKTTIKNSKTCLLGDPRKIMKSKINLSISLFFYLIYYYFKFNSLHTLLFFSFCVFYQIEVSNLTFNDRFVGLGKYGFWPQIESIQIKEKKFKYGLELNIVTYF